MIVIAKPIAIIISTAAIAMYVGSRDCAAYGAGAYVLQGVPVLKLCQSKICNCFCTSEFR